MLSLKSIPHPDESIVSRHMEGEAVLVHPSRGKVKVLNQVGAEVWKSIDGKKSVEAIVDDLAGRYAMDKQVLENDVLRFVGELLVRELIYLENQDLMGVG